MITKNLALESFEPHISILVVLGQILLGASLVALILACIALSVWLVTKIVAMIKRLKAE